MNFMLNNRVICPLILLILNGVALADSYVPPKAGLEPEMIRALQGVGQDVLNAKNSPSPTPPELDALRQRLDGVRKVLETVKPALLDPTKPSSASSDNDNARRKAKFDSDLDQASTELHNQNFTTASRVTDTKLNIRDRALVSAATAKVDLLEKEIDEIRALPDSDQTPRWLAMAKRLSGEDTPLYNPDTVRTPTISTLATHRN